MNTKALCFAVGICFAALAGTVLAADWPQWMGPARDSVWREEGIVEQFPEGGPPVRWRVPVAGGYAGPSVANGRVFVPDFVRQEGEINNNPNNRNELKGTERILCFDAATGDPLWTHQYDEQYAISYASGPRVTPTVDGDRVYTLGAEGALFCLNVENGQPIWSKNLPSEYKMETPIWGFCGHPLVDGDLLYCLVGGRESVAVAFDKHTGEEVWHALSAREPGYCPPTMIQIDGQKQLLIWHAEALNGLDPATGEVYWTQPLAPKYGMAIAAPRLSGELLFASGIGPVSGVYKIGSSPANAELVWGDNNPRRGVYCSNSTPFIEGDTIYGVGVHNGELCAADLRTGKRLWETFQATTGDRRASSATAFIVRHDDRFFLFNDQGELISARMDREGFQELDRAPILEPTNEASGRSVVWTHPAFANRSMYIRNDKELRCVSLATSP